MTVLVDDPNIALSIADDEPLDVDGLHEEGIVVGRKPFQHVVIRIGVHLRAHPIRDGKTRDRMKGIGIVANEICAVAAIEVDPQFAAEERDHRCAAIGQRNRRHDGHRRQWAGRRQEIDRRPQIRSPREGTWSARERSGGDIEHVAEQLARRHVVEPALVAILTDQEGAVGHREPLDVGARPVEIVHDRAGVILHQRSSRNLVLEQIGLDRAADEQMSVGVDQILLASAPARSRHPPFDLPRGYIDLDQCAIQALVEEHPEAPPIIDREPLH